MRTKPDSFPSLAARSSLAGLSVLAIGTGGEGMFLLLLFLIFVVSMLVGIGPGMYVAGMILDKDSLADAGKALKAVIYFFSIILCGILLTVVIGGIVTFLYSHMYDI